MNYEPVIGLEIHAQLRTQSKLFCACSTAFGAAPNTNICAVCTGQPGALPVLNRTAVEFALRAGLATHCTIAETSVFARKNYFYPDLPKGYQISQYDQPLCEHGYLDCAIDDRTKRVSITRIHMEEDAGKSLHDVVGAAGSCVDLNRSSVPLIEIVSGPDLRSADECVAYLKTMRTLLMYLGICDGNMQEGSLRCDANVSLRPVGTEKFGTRAELKNINSFRFLEHAIAFEIERQTEILRSGGTVIQETRLWDEKAGRSESMRSKEEAHDYRYFPDPDLPPLIVAREWIEKTRAELPELPEAKIARYHSELGLSAYDARVITAEQSLAQYFERAVHGNSAPKKIANWLTTELVGRLNTDGTTLADTKVQPADLGALVNLIESGKISGKIAKTVFDEMYQTGATPDTIVARDGLAQVSDTGTLEKAIDDIMAAQAENVALYRSGKISVLGFFVGQVMKATKGQANPQLLNELLKRKLGGA